MEFEHALSLLGVREGATAREVDQAFRRLAAIAHPDRGGEHDHMAKLSEARELLLRLAKPYTSTALTTLDQFRALASLINNASENKATIEAQVREIRKKLEIKSINRLKGYRLAAAIATAAFGACTFFGKEIPSQFFSYNENTRHAKEEEQRVKDAASSYHSLISDAKKVEEAADARVYARYDNEKKIIASMKSKTQSRASAQADADYEEGLRKDEKIFVNSKISALKEFLGSGIYLPGVSFGREVGRLPIAVDSNASGSGPSEAFGSLRQAIEVGAEDPDAIVNQALREAAMDAKLVQQREESASRYGQQVLFLLTCVFGSMAGLYNLGVKRAELMLEDLTEQLNSKTLAFRLLRNAFAGAMPAKFSLIELADAIEIWRKKGECDCGYIIRTLGSLGFAQYIAARSRQIELLEVSEELNDGEYAEHYRIKTIESGIEAFEVQ